MKNNNSSFSLMYTLKTVGKTGRIRMKDFYEIFCESVSVKDTPETRVNDRLKEIKALYERETSKQELYCWNIARIKETSEHYATSPINATAEFHNINPTNEKKEIANLEISGVIVTDTECNRTEDDSEANIFSVYVRYKEGIADCIADFETREEAQRFEKLLNEIANGLFNFI